MGNLVNTMSCERRETLQKVITRSAITATVLAAVSFIIFAYLFYLDSESKFTVLGWGISFVVMAVALFSIPQISLHCESFETYRRR